jgi:hypothetical protein
LDPLALAVAFVLAESFLSNVSPFVGASYTLIATLQLSVLGFTPWNFALVVLVSAVGAAAAKAVIYVGAFGLKDVLQRNRNVRLMGKYTLTEPFYLVLFVAALFPVFPFDDFIFIGGGAISASIGPMLGVTLLAKIIKSGVEVWLEFTVLSGLAGVLGGQSLLVTLGLTAVFVIIGIVLYSLDWERMLSRLGVKGQTGNLTQERV